MKLTVSEQQPLIHESEVHKCFLEREDIKILPVEEQRNRWEQHKVGLNKFREFLSGVECIGVISDEPAPEQR